MWAVTGAGYFWPIWVVASWGIGLVLHAWETFWHRPVTEADVDAELRRRPRVSNDRADGAAAHAFAWIVGGGTAAEVVAVALVVLFDVAVPTLVIVPMAGVSLLVRRQRFGSLGFRRPGTRRLVVQMLVFAIGWSIFQLSVIMPIVNHISGTTTDLTAFDGLEGNVAMLVGLLALSWTVSAVGEELA